LDDTVIGVSWGLSPHASSFKLKNSPFQKPRILLNIIKMSPRNSWKSDLLIC